MSGVLWQPAAVISGIMVCALIVLLGGEERPRVATVLTVLAPLAGIILLGPLACVVRSGETLTAAYNILPPLGLSFYVDRLSVALSLLFLFSGGVVGLYTGPYPLGDGQARFKAVFLFILACSTGVVLAGDLLSLFLFFEAMSLSFFILVIHDRQQPAVAATYKFLYMTVGGSVLYFIGLAAVFSQAGDLAWSSGGFVEAAPYALLSFACFIAAFGMKAGMFPLHLWMADVYGHAPAPAATLSSMIMLKTGAYGILRIVHQVFGPALLSEAGWPQAILVLAVISILYGSFCAFAEQDFLRRLAYSGVAQLGYILLGISLLEPDALVGGVYHILAHAMMKGTMLLCAGAILAKTGKRRISDLAGVGWEMPLTMSCFSLAALTAVGLPPMNIFISKWYLSLGALAAGKPLLILVLLASSLLNAAYYLPIATAAFFGGQDHGPHRKLTWDHLPWAMSLSIITLTAGCLGLGLGAANTPLEWARDIAASFFFQ